MRIRKSFLMVVFCACLVFHPSVVFTASILISWLPDTDPDLAGYKVYCGTQPGVYSYVFDAGNYTSYQISNVKGGTTYYVAVSAYDLSMNQSQLSAAQSITLPVSQQYGIVPLSPAMGSIVYANPVFAWSGSGFSTYKAYLSTDGKKYTRIYSGSGFSCSLQSTYWSLFIPSGTTLYWYVQGCSTAKTVQSQVFKFVKG